MNNKYFTRDHEIGVEVVRKNGNGRELSLGFILKGEDDYHFHKRPFMLLDVNDQENIAWILYELN